MSMLDSGTRLDPTRRNQGIGFNRPDPGSYQPVGLPSVPTNISTPGPDLFNALVGTGSLVANVGSFVEHRQRMAQEAFDKAEAEQRRQEAEARRTKAEQMGQAQEAGQLQRPRPSFVDPQVMEQYDFGLAATHASQDVADLPNRLELPTDDPRALRPAPNEDLRSFVTRWAAERTDGQTDAYAREYMRHVMPGALRTLGQKQAQVRDQTLKDGLQMQVQRYTSAVEAGDFEGARAAIDGAITIGKAGDKTEQDVRALFVPSIRAWADKGIPGTTESLIKDAQIEKYFPDTAVQLQNLAADRMRANQKQAWSDNEDAILNRRRDGEPVEMLKQAVTDLADAGKFDPNRAAVLTADFDRELKAGALDMVANEPSIQGKLSLLETPELTKHFSGHELATMKAAVTAEHRRQFVSDTFVGIREGTLTPDAALAALRERHGLYQSNPENPEGMAPDDYLEALVRLDAFAPKVKEIDLVKADISNRRAAPSGSPLPMTKEMHEGLLQTWVENGWAKGALTPDGKFAFSGVNRPEVAALDLTKLNSTVPAQWAEQIAAGFTSPYPQQQQKATRDFAALYLADKRLAEQVIGNDRMDDNGRARARSVMAQLDQRPRQMAALAPKQPAGSDRILGQTDDGRTVEITADYLKMLQGITTSAGQQAKVNLNDADIDTLFWGSKEDTQVRAKILTEGALVDRIPDAFRGSNSLMRAYSAVTPWSNERYAEMKPTTEQLNDYAKLAREEYRAARVANPAGSEADAVAQAKKLAASRWMATYQPVFWNNTISFQKADYPLTPDFDAQMTKALADLKKQGGVEQDPWYYKRFYAPVYRADLKPKAGGKAGMWLLVDPNGEVLTDRTGNPIGWQPDQAAEEETKKYSAEWRKKIEETGRAAFEHRQDLMQRFYQNWGSQPR